MWDVTYIMSLLCIMGLHGKTDKHLSTGPKFLKKDLSHCILHVQDEALYKLRYTNLKMENIQLPYIII